MSTPDEPGTGINYTIPTSLHTRAKALAAYKGQSLKAWLIRAIQSAVEQQEAERKRDRH